MTAFYNEIDPFAAQWLRNLIGAGLIAPGVVDERSIEDVRPEELAEFTQVHAFAGVGVWSYALRRAGWPDDRPVWTGSCPCQPFSAAGKGGGFADERHLWPAWFHLIRECRPVEILGEQVASKDGLGWFDLVSADLESEGYAIGVADLCAAGVGAPHIRQRLWFVGERMADASQPRLERRDARPVGVERAAAERDRAGELGRLAEPDPAERRPAVAGGHVADGRPAGRIEGDGQSGEFGEAGGMADASRVGRGTSGDRDNGRHVGSQFDANGGDGRPGPVNGLWRDADWLLCRDGKWRPVEPGTFPLAYGAPARVGRLRGYGNAINASAAQAFIEAYLGCRP